MRNADGRPTSNDPPALDLGRLRVFPLASRASMARVEDVLVDPDAPPPPLDREEARAVRECAARLHTARDRNASALLIFGAHLLKNGGSLIVDRLLAGGWVTHLATNGAGAIHDWEFAFLGRSTESVEKNVATGTFGTWDETGRYIHLALLAGGLRDEGFGRALGRLIVDDGTTLPEQDALVALVRAEPAHPLAPARAELLAAMRTRSIPAGRHDVVHPYKASSLLALAFERGVPLTVHPGIGYDIIANHPMFNGAVLGRAGGMDFRIFGAAVDRLDDGVVLSVGSAIMGPQVFEKSLSCVNNLRLAGMSARTSIVHGHTIYVVDIQEGGGWDWSRGEPPKDDPAYYLRFVKSYSRMGGTMRYVQCDNIAFLHNLLVALDAGADA